MNDLYGSYKLSLSFKPDKPLDSSLYPIFGMIFGRKNIHAKVMFSEPVKIVANASGILHENVIQVGFMLGDQE